MLNQEQRTNDPTYWFPHMSGYDAHLESLISESGLPVVKAQAFVYITQKQGKEMISSSNMLVKSEDPVWRITRHRVVSNKAKAPDSQLIEENLIESDLDRKLVWRWYTDRGFVHHQSGHRQTD